MKTKISPNANVHPSAIVVGCTIWDFSQVRENATLGINTSLGRGVYVGVGVVIGANCKIQNNALIYEPARVDDGVFIGPSVIFTNDHNPRAINASGEFKSSSDWKPVGVHVGYGASIGAGAICVAPVKIGKWAMIAAGSIITKDVPDFALVMGVPGVQVGWVGRNGSRLIEAESGEWLCPDSGEKYQILDGKLSLAQKGAL